MKKFQREISLENEYLKILIDPEKAGAIYYFLDKKKNFEWILDEYVFYTGKPLR